MRNVVISVLLLSVFFATPAFAKKRSSKKASGAEKTEKVEGAPAPSPVPTTATKPGSSPPAGAPKEEISVGARGPTRIDFDDRLIQGQTNKSGAVYLFDRKELAVKSMVRQRTSFRDQIVKDILTE